MSEERTESAPHLPTPPSTVDLEDHRAARFDPVEQTLFTAEPSPSPATTGSDVVLLTPAEIRQRHVPGYEILMEIGRGGMGVVYQARHERLNRLTALKMILSGPHSSDHERERFRREAEAVAALQHPHIVQIFEVGEADGFPFLSLEYVDGRSLAQVLDGAPWAARSAAGLVELLARAVHHAHERGIVHRDLKPGNVLLARTVEGEANDRDTEDRSTMKLRSFQPKITDFGLAKRFLVNDSESEPNEDNTMPRPPSGHTRTGAVMGTPSYIAPEQAAGKNRDVGPAADVYALGAILYELLTGRPPFRGETPLDTVLQVLSDEPVPPRALHSKVPRDLETICLKCLKKEPRKRYGSALELAEDLRRFMNHQPITARPVGWWERGMKLAKRRPTAVAMFLTVATAVLTLLGVSIGFNIELRKAAEREQGRASQASIAEQDARERAEEAKRQTQLAREAEQRAIDQQKEAERQALLAQEEFEKSRRSMYALQLTQVANLSETDPARGMELLQNRRRCPNDLRDLTWLYLRRLCQRQESVFKGHDGPINSITFSPDGLLLASASWDGTVRLWDAASGRTWAILSGHEGLVLAVAFAPDGKSLITGGDDRLIRVWEVPAEVLKASAAGQQPPANQEPPLLAPRETLSGHTDCIRCLAFAPDNRGFASGASDGTARLWEITIIAENRIGMIAGSGIRIGTRTTREKNIILTHKSVVWSIAFSPDGQTLATGGEDRNVCWHDLSTRTPSLKRTEKHPEAVIALAFAPDGLTLASVCNTEDAVIHLWDTHRGTERAKLRGHTRAVYGIAFSRSGKWLASGSFDRTVRLWDSETGEERTVFKGHEASVRCVAFSPDRKTLASAGMDQTIRLWAVNSQPSETITLPVRIPLTAAAWSRDGGLFVTGGRDGIARIWRTGQLSSRNTFEEVGRLVGHVGPVLSIALTNDGQTIVTSSEDESVRVWKVGAKLPIAGGNPQEFRQSAILTGINGPVRSLAFSPDESLLAGAADRGMRVWRMQDGKTVPGYNALSGRVRFVAFSPDGKHLVNAVGRNVQLWDTSTGKLAFTMMLAHLGEIDAVAFNRTGETLATADVDGGVKVWDVPTNVGGKLVERAVLAGHTDAVQTLAFTNDGRTIITGSRDRTIRLWDPITGQERATLKGHSDAVLELMLTTHRDQPIGLLSASRDGSVKWWQTAPGK